MRFRFLGDVHAQFDIYLNNLIDRNNFDISIQLGDFGFGFAEPPNMTESDFCIRGNHDNPKLAEAHPNCIADGSIIKTNNHTLMFIGGAESTDKAHRALDNDLWLNEENSYSSLDDYGIIYRIEKPDVMITHTCPDSVIPNLFHYNDIYPSRTGQFFSTILEFHKPKLWIFGHFHQSVDVTIDGTRFLCIDANCFDTIDL